MPQYSYIKFSGITAVIQACDDTYVHLWLSESLIHSLYVDFKTGNFTTNDRISDERLNDFVSEFDANEIKRKVVDAMLTKNLNIKPHLLNKSWMNLWIQTNDKIQKVMCIGDNNGTEDLDILGEIGCEYFWGSKKPKADELNTPFQMKHTLGLFVSDENTFYEVVGVGVSLKQTEEFIRENHGLSMIASTDKFHFIAETISC